MKRDIALQGLSHQHHNALTGCLLIKKGVQKKADSKVLNDFTLQLWKEDLVRHFDVEEKVLLPHVEKVDPHASAIIRQDHERLRLLAERIGMTQLNGYPLYNVFANLLEQHIRFEERIVFNKLQERLAESELTAIGNSLNGISSRKCTDYPVKFWE